MLKVLLVVAAIAFVVWLLVKLTLRRLDGGSSSRPRVIGPDDDPDFLSGLDRPRKPEDD
ncbi:hypothetical protein F4692_002050 [Nocardioides cavernae]|uniref:Uncharacterized protein n=1 Tax=Nocardioides cavernae TaxID=1921566 RepID=A0A7Y9H2U1_9ACTN|nr:hypothetical protein [Nocardioides cavernae]NYE36917.1 hypothetical protein [Nocardioides cavernae]